MPHTNDVYGGDNYTFGYVEMLAETDTRIADAQSAWLAAIDSNLHLDRKTHELIRMVCTAAQRNAPGVERHARFAAESGASWEEIVSALALTQPAFGVLAAAEALPHARSGFESAESAETDE